MAQETASVFELVSRTVRQTSGLTADLIALASAEVGEGLGNLVKGLGVLIAGLAVILIGVLFLLHGAVAWLVLFGWSEAASYGMVGGATFAIAVVLMIFGGLLLRNASPIPTRALNEVQSLLKARND